MFTWYQLPSPLTQPQPPASAPAAAGSLQPKPEPGVSTAPVSPPPASVSPVTVTVSSTNTGAPQSWWWRRDRGGATSNLQSGRGHQHFNSLCLEIWYRTTKDCHGPRSPHTTVQNCRCSDHKAEKKNQWHYNNQKYLNTSIILSFSSYLWIDV